MARKPIAKSAAVEKKIEMSLASLETACVAGNRAVTARSRDAKKLAASTKRLAKKKSVLIKRKGVASRRVKRSPSAETRKALRTVVKELASTSKELTKARGLKKANATELASLKAAQRRANGYAKAIAKVDQAFNKKTRRRS